MTIHALFMVVLLALTVSPLLLSHGTELCDTNLGISLDTPMEAQYGATVTSQVIFCLVWRATNKMTACRMSSSR